MTELSVSSMGSAVPSMTVVAARDLGCEINRAHEAACRAASSAIDHARRAGDLLPEAKAQLPHGAWLPWLAEHCPDLQPRVAQNYMKIATGWSRLDAANTKRDSHLPIRDALALLTSGQPRVVYHTGDFEWYSPPAYLDAARSVLGHIDLDPASTDRANTVVRARQFYTVQDDGLSQEWRGRIWMNPPYAQPLVTQFCEKLAESVRARTVSDAIVLINNCTETRFFAALMRVASALCLPTGRVDFWKPDRITDGPLQGQAVVYIGEGVDRFATVFSRFGIVAEIRRDLLVAQESAAR
jgi:ParB family chromosome partitioning protein